MTTPLRAPALGWHALLACIVLALGGCSDSDDKKPVDPPPPPPPVASANADLAALSLSAGTLAPVFQPSTTSYAATVDNSVASVTLTAIKSDAGASLQINGVTTASGAASAPIDLATGNTTISVLVTAANGTSTRTYSVAVTRQPPPASTDATLSALSVSVGALSPAFDPGVMDYATSVASSVDSTTVTATATDPGATITIGATAVASAAPSAPIALGVGTTEIPVNVTAADGQAQQAYIVTVTRAAPPAVQKTMITLLVLDTDGSLVEGAAVVVAGTGDSAVTGGDGRATVPVAESAPQLLRVSKSGFADQFIPLDLQSGTDPTVFVTGMTRLAAPVRIAAIESGGTAVGRDGARIVLPPGAMVNSAGQPVIGPIDVFMTPVNVLNVNARRAFPGAFAGRDDNGAETLMLSHGVMDVRFEQNGAPLKLAAGSTAEIDIPIYTTRNKDGGTHVAGASIPVWSLDETTGRWQQEGSGTVVAAAGSPTGFAQRSTVTHFSWWNCDDFAASATARITVWCNASGESCGAGAQGLRIEAQVLGNGGPVASAAGPIRTDAPTELLIAAEQPVQFTVLGDGAFTADVTPNPVTASANTTVEVEVVVKPLHRADGAFTPGEYLRGEMTTVGEAHEYRFEGRAGMSFRVVAYPAASVLSPPGFTGGTLAARVAVLSGPTELGAASFESNIAGDVEVTLPADGEYIVRFVAEGKVPGWYVATTRLRAAGASSGAGVLFLAQGAYSTTMGAPNRLMHVAEPGGSLLELTGAFPAFAEGISANLPPTAVTGQGYNSWLPRNANFEESTPGRIVYIADQQTKDLPELFYLDFDRPGQPVRMNGPEVASQPSANAEVAEFRISAADRTRVVYHVRVGFNADLFIGDTDTPGTSVRIGKPALSLGPFEFALARDGRSVVYLNDSARTTSVGDDNLYLVDLDAPTQLTIVNHPLDFEAGALMLDYEIHPDGRHVAYRARLGSTGPVRAYLADLDDPGKAIELNGLSNINTPLLDRVRALRFTPDGRHLIVLSASSANVSTGPLYAVNIANPGQPGAPVRLTADSTIQTWLIAPDSDLVLFEDSHDVGGARISQPGVDLVIVNTPATLWLPRNPVFTPDGGTLLLRLQNRDTREWQLYSQELTTGGALTRLDPAPPHSDPTGVLLFELAADGDTIYFVAEPQQRNLTGITTVRLSDPGDVVQVVVPDPAFDRVVAPLTDQAVFRLLE
jgi:hypothetical protein